MSLFSFKEIDVKPESKEAENYSAFTSKLLNIQTSKIEKLSTDLLRLPQDGECIFLQTMQAFNAFTFVEYIARLQFIEEVYASTYSVNMRVLEALQEMQKLGRIGKINLLISDSMQKRNPRVCDSLNAWAQTCGVSIIYTWNHSKITLCKTEQGFYCIEGSGNWSENACYEQYTFVNSEEVFKLRKSLFEECKVVFRIN